MKLKLLVLFAFLVPGQAFAFCSEPYARLTIPTAPGSFNKPDVPYCLSSYKFSGSHTCDQWEIDSYKREIERYVDNLQTYVDEAYAVAKEASNYADEVQAYAECEAKEVSSQHQ